MEKEFILKLLLTAFLGILLVVAMWKMAKSNPASKMCGKKSVKVLAAIFTLFAVTCVWHGNKMLRAVSVTVEDMSAQKLESMSEVLSPDQMVQWKIMTYEHGVYYKMMTINDVFMTFMFVALAVYCFFFKASERTSGQKMLRFGFIALLYIFYMGSVVYNSKTVDYFNAINMCMAVILCALIGYVLFPDFDNGSPKTAIA